VVAVTMIRPRRGAPVTYAGNDLLRRPITGPGTTPPIRSSGPVTS